MKCKSDYAFGARFCSSCGRPVAPFQTDWQTIKSKLEAIAKNPVSFPQPELESQMFWHRASQGGVMLRGNEVQQFGEIIRELMKDDVTFNNFTMKELEGLTQDSVLRILKAEPIRRRNEIDRQIVELRKRLKEDVEPETFIIPVTNLILERRQLRIGNVKLFHFTDSHVKRWESMFYNASSRYTLEERKKQCEDVRKNVLEKLKGSICAEVTVKGKHRRALEVALQQVRNALSAIMVFFPEDIRKPLIGIRGEVIHVGSGESHRFILSVSSDKSIHLNSEHVGSFFELKLDKKRIAWMFKRGFTEISVLLAKQKMNSFESRLKTAIYWLGSAMNVPITRSRKEMDVRISLAREKKSRGQKTLEDFEFHDIAERLIKLMMALESLVILDDREQIVSNLGERTAFLVAKKPSDRIYVSHRIKELYRLRSRFIHHGRIEMTYSELYWLSCVVQAAILRLITDRNRLGISNDDEFRNWLVTMKFS